MMRKFLLPRKTVCLKQIFQERTQISNLISSTPSFRRSLNSFRGQQPRQPRPDLQEAGAQDRILCKTFGDHVLDHWRKVFREPWPKVLMDDFVDELVDGEVHAGVGLGAAEEFTQDSPKGKDVALFGVTLRGVDLGRRVDGRARAEG